LEGVLRQYENFVKPAHELYIAPTKSFADIIIPRGAKNLVALDVVEYYVKKKLKERAPRRKKVLRKQHDEC